jgi:hypothetical protein
MFLNEPLELNSTNRGNQFAEVFTDSVSFVRQSLTPLARFIQIKLRLP